MATGRAGTLNLPVSRQGGRPDRITSYNVCYTKLLRLIRPAALATYRRLEDTGPAGSHWYEHQDAHQRIRLLWSEQLQYVTVEYSYK